MDPRVKTPAAALDEQFTLSMRVYDAIARVHGKLTPPPQTTDEEAAPTASDPLRRLHRQLRIAYDALQEVDVAPTAAVRMTTEDLLKQVEACCRR